MTQASELTDVVVIGGGQAGLALGYYLRRTELSWKIMDDGEAPGGAWRAGWDSLRLFSPARWSSLPGRLMQGGDDDYPTRAEALEYFEWYEGHYDLPVERPVHVTGVRREGDVLSVETTEGTHPARAVISATGTWRNPVVPNVPGRQLFRGLQLHSAEYRNADDLQGKRVAVVGAGNSAAQILAEVSKVAETVWCTLETPRFLPDDVDGRYLFDQATIRYRAKQQGLPVPPAASLGDIVMVPPVKDARVRGVLQAQPMFSEMTETGLVWPDGTSQEVDGVIWATGFRAALEHLRPLEVIGPDGRIEVEGTRSKAEPQLWLVGYGGWTGFASATIIGVGRTARQTVQEVEASLPRPVDGCLEF